MTNPKYDGMTYIEAIAAGWRLLDKDSIKIYSPNVVSYRKKVISA